MKDKVKLLIEELKYSVISEKDKNELFELGMGLLSAINKKNIVKPFDGSDNPPHKPPNP